MSNIISFPSKPDQSLFKESQNPIEYNELLKAIDFFSKEKLEENDIREFKKAKQELEKKEEAYKKALADEETRKKINSIRRSGLKDSHKVILIFLEAAKTVIKNERTNKIK